MTELDAIRQQLEAAEARAEAAERQLASMRNAACIESEKRQGEWQEAAKPCAICNRTASQMLTHDECLPCKLEGQRATAQAKLAASEAAAGAMRAAIGTMVPSIIRCYRSVAAGELSGPFPIDVKYCDRTLERVEAAIANPAGQGFISPAEAEQLRAELAACRAALEKLSVQFDAYGERHRNTTWLDGPDDHWKNCIDATTLIHKALSGQAARELLASQRAKDEVLAGFVEGARAKDQRIATLTDLLRRAIAECGEHDREYEHNTDRELLRDAALVLGDKP